MAYDVALDDEVASVVGPWGAERKAMFGGTGYLIRGNMVGGVHGDALILRMSPSDGEAALAEPGVRPFDMTRRPMAGWVMVDRGALAPGDVERWLTVARTFVETLPAK